MHLQRPSSAMELREDSQSVQHQQQNRDHIASTTVIMQRTRSDEDWHAPSPSMSSEIPLLSPGQPSPNSTAKLGYRRLALPSPGLKVRRTSLPHQPIPPIPSRYALPHEVHIADHSTSDAVVSEVLSTSHSALHTKQPALKSPFVAPLTPIIPHEHTSTGNAQPCPVTPAAPVSMTNLSVAQAHEVASTLAAPALVYSNLSITSSYSPPRSPNPHLMTNSSISSSCHSSSSISSHSQFPSPPNGIGVITEDSSLSLFLSPSASPPPCDSCSSSSSTLGPSLFSPPSMIDRCASFESPYYHDRGMSCASSMSSPCLITSVSPAHHHHTSRLLHSTTANDSPDPPFSHSSLSISSMCSTYESSPEPAEMTVTLSNIVQQSPSPRNGAASVASTVTPHSGQRSPLPACLSPDFAAGISEEQAQHIASLVRKTKRKSNARRMTMPMLPSSLKLSMMSPPNSSGLSAGYHLPSTRGIGAITPAHGSLGSGRLASIPSASPMSSSASSANSAYKASPTQVAAGTPSPASTSSLAVPSPGMSSTISSSPRNFNLFKLRLPSASPEVSSHSDLRGSPAADGHESDSSSCDSESPLATPGDAGLGAEDDYGEIILCGIHQSRGDRLRNGGGNETPMKSPESAMSLSSPEPMETPNSSNGQHLRGGTVSRRDNFEGAYGAQNAYGLAASPPQAARSPFVEGSPQTAPAEVSPVVPQLPAHLAGPDALLPDTVSLTMPAAGAATPILSPFPDSTPTPISSFCLPLQQLPSSIPSSTGTDAAAGAAVPLAVRRSRFSHRRATLSGTLDAHAQTSSSGRPSAPYDFGANGALIIEGWEISKRGVTRTPEVKTRRLSLSGSPMLPPRALNAVAAPAGGSASSFPPQPLSAALPHSQSFDTSPLPPSSATPTLTSTSTPTLLGRRLSFVKAQREKTEVASTQPPVLTHAMSLPGVPSALSAPNSASLQPPQQVKSRQTSPQLQSKRPHSRASSLEFNEELLASLTGHVSSLQLEGESQLNPLTDAALRESFGPRFKLPRQASMGIELKLSDLVRIGEIGRGVNGAVHKAVYLPTLTIVALKSVSIFDKDERHQFLQELRAFLQCESDQMVRFIGACFSEGKITMALEYLNRGSLDHVIKQSGPLKEGVIRLLTQQLLMGLRDLHANNFLHRDIKPANFLFTNRGVSKLSDFGLLKQLATDDHGEVVEDRKFVGTMLYLSPERIAGKPFSFPSDIYAVGLSIIYLATGALQAVPKDYWALVQGAVNAPSPTLPPKGSDGSNDFSSQMRDFVDCMMHKDPTKRWTADQLLLHPWFTEAEKSTSEEDPLDSWPGRELLPPDEDELAVLLDAVMERWYPTRGRDGSPSACVGPNFEPSDFDRARFTHLAQQLGWQEQPLIDAFVAKMRERTVFELPPAAMTVDREIPRELPKSESSSDLSSTTQADSVDFIHPLLLSATSSGSNSFSQSMSEQSSSSMSSSGVSQTSTPLSTSSSSRLSLVRPADGIITSRSLSSTPGPPPCPSISTSTKEGSMSGGLGSPQSRPPKAPRTQSLDSADKDSSPAPSSSGLSEITTPSRPPRRLSASGRRASFSARLNAPSGGGDMSDASPPHAESLLRRLAKANEHAAAMSSAQQE